jgi:hypothetical protein
VEYYVNGFHIKSHRPECADHYGASYAPLMAIRIAEEVEGHHKKGNRNQWSTREMDAGARQDTITAHMLYSNIAKFNNMRESSLTATNRSSITTLLSIAARLLERANKAKENVKEFSAELHGLEESLDSIDEGILTRFRKTYQSSGAEQFRPNQHRVKCV